VQAVAKFAATHWKEIALAVMLFAISFLWWRDHKGLVGAYEASVEGYEQRIQELKKSHKRETERKEAALNEYRTKISELETEYFEYKQAIEEEREERVDELIILRQDEPEQLIHEIESRFGFEYVE
jgi:TolA-binding protein